MTRTFVAFLVMLAASAACSQASNPVVYVTATPNTIPSGEPPLPNPFHPTPTPIGPTATPLQPTPNPTFPPANKNISYSVQNGDTLASIAQVFGTTVEQIIALNSGMSQLSVIYPGQVLTVPGTPNQTTPNAKIIPDSELVYSPGVSSGANK